MGKLIVAASLILAACADNHSGKASDLSASPAPEDRPMTSPAMTEIDALVGAWRIEGPGGSCTVTLSSQDRPLTPGAAGTPMMAADFTSPCAGLERVRGWVPAPMAVALTGEDGMTVAFFERTGPDAYRSIDQRFSLTRP